MTELTIRVLRAEDPNPTPETYAARSSEKQEPAQSTLITYGSRKAGALRQSRRIRQGKELGRRRKVTITRTMTVKDLKVQVRLGKPVPLNSRAHSREQIQEELDIPTISQRLYYQGKELNDNAKTLSSLGVLSNDVMDLREESEDVDLLGSTSDSSPPKREEGNGFGGTLLGSSRPASSAAHSSSQHEDEPELGQTSRSCPVCTYDNAPDASACAMCETSF